MNDILFEIKLILKCAYYTDIIKMLLEFLKDLPDNIRDCCEHGFRKSMCPIKCSHFVRIKQDLQHDNK